MDQPQGDKKKLTTGILPFLVPLRLQSLLFIIGHLDEYENETLALLPPRTRRTLLFNLPVIDVCKLEGSGVTEDIDMEEVWKTLYYNRLPTEQKSLKQFLTTVDDMEELTWKDCYFSSVFCLKFAYGPLDNDCYCIYSIYSNHLHQDLLYGMYVRDGTLEVQECFGHHSRSCFGVETSARHCSRLAPVRYIHQFPDQMNTADRRCYDHVPPSVYATIPRLVEECKFEAKRLSTTDKALKQYFDDECFTDDYFPYLKSFFGSVRCLQITHDSEQLHPGWKCLLDAIVCTPCKLNELCIYQTSTIYYYGAGDPELNRLMAFVAPYFSPTPDTLPTPYSHLRKVHIEGAIQSPADAWNTALILNHQNDLEVLTVNRCNCFSSETSDRQTECITLAFAALFKKSSFRELVMSSTSGVPSSLVVKLVHQFFSSQSPNHQQLRFDHVTVLPDKTALAVSTPPPAVGSRSMEITQCTLQPEIASVFPPSMTFRNLTLDIGAKQGSTVLDLFSHVHSLQVESMSLSIYTSNQNSKAIVKLLNLVDTRNWSLHLQFVVPSPHYDWNLTPESIATVVDAVTDIAPALGQLVAKGIVPLLSFASTAYFGKLPESVLEALFEEIFQGLQSSQSEVELDLSGCQLNTDTLECLYRTWKRCTDVKLKKLDLSWNELADDDLQQMTETLIHAFWL